jgi:hypothetical protein
MHQEHKSSDPDNGGAIVSASSAAEIGTALPGYWFRGHQEVDKELMPKAQRESYGEGGAVRERLSNVELFFFNEFRRKAPAIGLDLPRADDHLKWLFLMQHHGVPTRLLDWTESILVALYFAARGHTDVPGEVWAMNPWHLNWHAYKLNLVIEENEVAQDLAIEAAGFQLKTKTGKAKASRKFPICVPPTLLSPRMYAQQSVFTLHPSTSVGSTIHERFKISDPSGLALVSFKVPAEAKDPILDDLLDLGTTYSTLFPDLDGLSKGLRDQVERAAVAIDESPRGALATFLDTDGVGISI